MRPLAVALVGLDPDTTAQLRDGLVLADAEARELASEELLGRIGPEAGTALDAVVLSDELADPVSLVQAVQRADAEVAAVVLCRPERQEELAHEIQFAPSISANTHCRSYEQLDQLPAELAELAAAARQRRRHQVVVQSIETEVPAGADPVTGNDALDRLLDAAPIAVIALDEHLEVVAANRRATAVLEGQDLVGRRFCELFDADQAEQLTLFLAPATHAGSSEVFSRELSQSDQLVELTVGRFVSSSGSPGVLVLADDVTARVSAEREKAALEEARSFRASTGALLEVALDPVETLQRIAELAVPARSDLCLVDVLSDDGRLHGVAFAAADPAVAEAIEAMRDQYPLDPAGPHPVAQVVRSGKPALLEQMREETYRRIAQSDDHLALMRRLHYRSAIVVPLKARGRMLGAISLLYLEQGRRYSENDVELLADVARRAALALDNARLYEQQREAAMLLQRSLLPAQLPRVPGLDLVAHYRAAEGEVGGDWYDALAMADGTAVCTVGDVVGRGLGAAAVMGQLRNAMRAYALEHPRPAALVQALDRLVEQLDVGLLTTLLCARIDPGAGTMTYSCAGHMPPLLITASGEAQLLTGGRSRPLGTGATHVEATVQFPPGAMLLGYTDGLVETRDAPITERLELLRETAAGAATGAVIDTVLSVLSSRSHSDDIAVLAARRTE